MMTVFTATKVKGKGRGKFLGFPTINLAVPAGFELAHGVYAVWVTINGTKFRGAMHWGPIPTFDDTDVSLEVFVLGVGDAELAHADLTKITIEPVMRLRDIKKFPTIDELTKQMELDVFEVRKNLRE
jgi:riboflavin kinase / FMN adenylyltransferase